VTPPPPRRRKRVLLGLLAATVVLALAAGGVWAYVMSQYFVGVLTSEGESEQVAIFRGVNAELVGLDFYRVHSETGIAVSDLTASARSSVMGGIPADNLDAAQGILDNLLDARLPLCEQPPTSPTATPTTAGTPAPSTTQPPAGQPSVPQSTPGASPSGTADPTSASTADSTSTSQADRTGVNCREAN